MDEVHTARDGEAPMVVEVPVDGGLVDGSGSESAHEGTIDGVDVDGATLGLAIGIDTCGTEYSYDDVLIFADPYDVTNHFQDGYYTFPLARFFYMWHEGLCAHKQIPYQQPFVAAYPKELI